ncbi:MAG TPA: hypothetical protein VFE24_02440, partial [Pirellulales bacterium]|nr:hypothetical protein [Pirellulales bacterium]
MSPTRSGGRFWLVGICVLLSTLGLPALAARPAASTANPTAAPAVDLTGVPADAFGVIVLQPRRLISAPEFKDYPVEILSAM